MLPNIMPSRKHATLAWILVFLGVSTAFISNAATNLVMIRELGLKFVFNPTNIVIHTGDVVKWTNLPNNAFHDSTHRSPEPLWASPKLSNAPPNNTFSFTFNNAGSYPYFCATHVLSHPEQTGTVAVVSMNLPPSVSIDRPTNNTPFFAPARFTIVANASDLDGSVAQVEFFRDATSLGARTTTPYNNIVSNLAAGAYALIAVATDNLGGKSTSSVVNVTVSPPPTISFGSAQRRPDGSFEFVISGGSAGQTCAIDASSPLAIWSQIAITNFPNTTCPACPVIDFIDADTTQDQRFYRARVFP